MEGAEVLKILSYIGTGLGAVFVGRSYERAKTKKVDAEAESIALSSSSKAVAIWEGLNGQLHKELESLRIQVVAIQKENQKLHDENVELKQQVQLLRDEVARLKNSM